MNDVKDGEVLFYETLRDFKNADPIFNKTWFTYREWEPGRRARWIEHMKSSARDGLPFAVRIVNEVTIRRLKS